MLTDEELRKIQRNAKRAVDDMGKGATITLAMDPVVMFAMASELLHHRAAHELVRRIDLQERMDEQRSK